MKKTGVYISSQRFTKYYFAAIDMFFSVLFMSHSIWVDANDLCFNIKLELWCGTFIYI